MTLSPFKFLVSVKAKLFAGFLAMTLLIAGLGGYALLSIGNAGQVVTDTFDRPLMAVNFARSAGQTFAALEIETLRPSDVDNPQAEFDRLVTQFREDLEVARARSIAPRAESFFDDIVRDFSSWERSERARLGQTGTAQLNAVLSNDIEENLDIVIELQTNQSFRNREQAISTMARIRRFSLIAVVTALILTLGLTAWIAMTIVRPLKAAAGAAAQISAGRFDVIIPKGGEDETGQLLKSMRSMQTNIRDRMAQEQDLRTLAQHRLADSLENSKDGVLLTDIDGCIIVANPGVGQLFQNLFAQPLVGQMCGTLFAADGVPVGLSQDGPQQSGEFQLDDGRWLRVNASATREGGRLFIWSDITESKQRTEHLRQARDAAEAASRAKTMFMAAMSHELNTPLNAIVGLSDMLQLEYRKPGRDPSHADMAGLISQSGSHIAHIVRDVLEIANDDTEVIDPATLSPVDLGKAVDQAVSGVRDLAAQTGVRLIWTKPSAVQCVRGDAPDLKQLAAKLLDNAVKFNRSGGAVKAQLSETQTGQIRLDIIDTGIGIDPQNFDHILQPFQQVDEGYSRAVNGTGLGLSIVDRIAKRHGAELKIRSALDKGSVFSVIFPESNSMSEPPHQTESHAA